MIEIDDLVIDISRTTEEYICYTLTQKIQLFSRKVRDDADCNIYISRKLRLGDILNKLIAYIDEINHSGEKLKSYYENLLNEKVYDNWFNDIEVFSVEITFISIDDYGTTIICSDQILQDHILEIYYDQNEIEQILLNG